MIIRKWVVAVKVMQVVVNQHPDSAEVLFSDIISPLPEDIVAFMPAMFDSEAEAMDAASERVGAS